LNYFEKKQGFYPKRGWKWDFFFLFQEKVGKNKPWKAGISLFLVPFLGSFHLFDGLKDRLDSRLRGRRKGLLDLIDRIMIGEEFRYVQPEFPADDDPFAGQGLIHRAAIAEGDISS
jgi:hypothetical protein